MGKEVHATHASADDGPLVAKFIVILQQSFFEGIVPLLLVVAGLNVSEIPD